MDKNIEIVKENSSILNTGRLLSDYKDFSYEYYKEKG